MTPQEADRMANTMSTIYRGLLMPDTPRLPRGHYDTLIRLHAMLRNTDEYKLAMSLYPEKFIPK